MGSFNDIQGKLFANQCFDVVQMGTGRSMIVVLGDARGKVNHDVLLLDLFFLQNHSGEIVQLPHDRPPAASAAGHVEGSVLFVFRVVGESSIALMKRLFTQIAGASFHHDVALNDYDVLLVHIHSVLSFRSLLAERRDLPVKTQTGVLDRSYERSVDDTKLSFLVTGCLAI